MARISAHPESRASWCVIADDLTGACDTGAAFARRGWGTRVAFSPEADFGEAAARVVSTESRGLSQEAAARAVERAVLGLKLSGTDWIYKKIDSTLRGHPGVELAAVMRVARIERALVAPAFPAQGRVVRDGRLFVSGVPVEETTFAKEITRSDMQRMFADLGEVTQITLETIRQGRGRIAEMLAQLTHGVVIADAETDADLLALAQTAVQAGLRLLCGSAGLARALVETLPHQERKTIPESSGGPVLVIAGSRSAVTLRQVESIQAAGIQVIYPDIATLRVASEDSPGNPFETENPGDNPAMEIKTLISERLIQCLRSGEPVAVSVGKMDWTPGAEAALAARLAVLTREAFLSVPPGGLVLTGGETAAAVFRALGCTVVDLGGEVQPGVVWGRLADGPFTGLPVVTKAGGFGSQNTLLAAIRFLSGKKPASSG